MSETNHILGEMAERLLAGELDDRTMRSAREGSWPEAAWQAVMAQGLGLALVEGEQGFGLPLTEGLALIGLLGRHVAPLPLGETMIANAILAKAGLPVVDGLVAMVPEGHDIVIRQDGRNWLAAGAADRIVWGRRADALLIETDGRLACMTSHFRTGQEGNNLAGMARDHVIVDGPVEIAPLPDGLSLMEAGALVRILAMAGAMRTLATLTIRHVSDRKQFGRALSAFQVVQHGLARLASEAAAASAAADLASDSFASDSPHRKVAIAAARARIGEAVGIAVSIAHQLHGAIGFTEEHRLHWFTTALWAWRDEFGTTAWWTRRLGAAALGQSRSSYWPLVTAV